jgi:antitoxin component YwqK of YwqJK toxin-antitoxin module
MPLRVIFIFFIFHANAQDTSCVDLNNGATYDFTDRVNSVKSITYDSTGMKASVFIIRRNLFPMKKYGKREWVKGKAKHWDNNGLIKKSRSRLKKRIEKIREYYSNGQLKKQTYLKLSGHRIPILHKSWRKCYDEKGKRTSTTRNVWPRSFPDCNN